MSNFVDLSSPHSQPTLEEVPQQTVLLTNYFPAEAACSFSLLAQRKQNQKTILSGTKWDAQSAPVGATPRMAWIKGHPTICPLCGFPVLLAAIGAKINSLRSNKFLLDPMTPAMLGYIEGTKSKTPDLKLVH